jgi:hypothetical protein
METFVKILMVCHACKTAERLYPNDFKWNAKRIYWNLTDDLMRASGWIEGFNS